MLALVPTDSAWLTDVRLKETLLANFREKVDHAVAELAQATGKRDIKVLDVGNAIVVEVADPAVIASEKGTPAFQMVKHEGTTVPIRTPVGTVFRKVTRLSLLMGKWRKPALQKREHVKGAIDRAFSESAEAVVKTKEDLEGMRPLRVVDILGVR